MKNNIFLEQSLSTLNRFNKFYEKGDFVIGFITDVHTGGNKHYEHYKYFFDLAKDYHTDLLINGGDIGLGLGESKEEADKLINNTINNSNTDIPFIYVLGNHDARSDIKTKDLYRLLMPKRFAGLFFNEENGYGEYRIEEHQLSVIFLNTSDGNDTAYNISNSQIKWLINVLSEIKEDYRVVIVSHLCMDQIGAWGNSIIDNQNILLVQKIITDFNNHSKGFNGTFAWDFSSKTNVILFELAGDSHFDNYINRDGLNIVVREGYGGILPKDVPPGGKHYKFSANEGIEDVKDCLFDIICIKPTNRIKVFRIGVGDQGADLEF